MRELSVCCDVKQVLTPSELTHKFTAQNAPDTIADTKFHLNLKQTFTKI